MFKCVKMYQKMKHDYKSWWMGNNLETMQKNSDVVTDPTSPISQSLPSNDTSTEFKKEI